MIKAVLFDLDNTLVDFLKFKTICSKAAISAMRKAGLKIKEEKALKILFGFYKKTRFEGKTVFQDLLKEILGEVDYKILGAGIVAYRKARYGVLKPYPNVVKTLEGLKRRKLKLGIVTDAPRLKAWIRLSSANIADFFDFVITVADVKRRKPSPSPFKRALRTLKFKPKEILFIGDSLKKDIAGAKKIGMKTVFAEYGDFEKRKPKNEYEMPDYRIKNIKEILKILK